jgi:hypothetical protein
MEQEKRWKKQSKRTDLNRENMMNLAVPSIQLRIFDIKFLGHETSSGAEIKPPLDVSLCLGHIS